MKIVILPVLILAACTNESWTCKRNPAETKLFSVSSSGIVGAATKGCSCAQIIDFQKETGIVDLEILAELDCLQ